MLNFAKCLFIMLKAHKGQKDKGGHAYWRHPLHVAIKVKGIKAKEVALLHDVLEDCKEYCLNDFNFLNQEQIEALALLRHDLQVPYDEYVESIKSNRLAKAVKVADLLHNSDLSRLKEISKKDIVRNQKYKKAIDILTN